MMQKHRQRWSAISRSSSSSSSLLPVDERDGQWPDTETAVASTSLVLRYYSLLSSSDARGVSR